MQFIDLQKQYQALKTNIDNAIHKVLDSSNYILGNQVKELESELAEYVGTEFCVTCANGTDALTLAIETLNLQSNDVVFVPTFTFFASAETVSQNGNKIVFVDSDERTFNISTEKLEQAILKVKNNGENPKVIVAVDLFGQCANYPEIVKIAEKYGMQILEDGAQGFGGSVNGKKACSFGNIATTSFFPAKPLGCYGDGGAIFTNDKQTFELLQSLRVHGKGSDKYDNVRLGYNSRLDTIQAGILIEKLKAFKNFELDRRNEIAKIYTDNLIDVVETPFVPENFISSWAQYTIKLSDSSVRNSLQTSLKQMGIPSMVYYPTCMHNQTVYKNCNFDVTELKVSERLTQQVLSLPMHPYLENNEVLEICDAVKNALK